MLNFGSRNRTTFLPGSRTFPMIHMNGWHAPTAGWHMPTRGWHMPAVGDWHFDMPNLPWQQRRSVWQNIMPNVDLAHFQMPSVNWRGPWRRQPAVTSRNGYWMPRPSWGDSDRLIAFCAGMAVGALCVYLLDPELGNTRRKLAANRTAGVTRRGLRGARRFGRKLSADVSGKMQAAIHTRAAQQIVDDATLAHKVESILFRDPDIPKGDISINCEEGTVVLRGAISRTGLIPEIAQRVRDIDGVQDVRNLLHPAGTPAP